jgi:hypothetical protein
MKRSEAEPAIRALAHQWAEATGIGVGSADQPSFNAFKRWAEVGGYGGYFAFRSTMGPLDDAERWFDQELCQTWRH